MSVLHTKHFTILLVTLLLSGCATVDTPMVTTPPPLTPPQQWQAATSAPLTPVLETGWQQQFNDPTLHTLIKQALQKSYSVEKARLRWQQAQQQRLITSKITQPTSTLSATAARTPTQSSGISSQSSILNLELSTQWEADLWQRLSDQQQATLQQERASAADLEAATLSITAEITRSWFSAIAAQQQYQLSSQQLNRYQQAATITEQRYRSGLTSALDLHLTRSEVAMAQAQLATDQQQQQKQLRALERLTGHYPAATLSLSSTLPSIPETIPAGLPATLLERRPDLQASHARLKAAGLAQQIAQKNRLPSLSLTATAGTSSSELHQLLDWNYLVWNLLGSLTQPLFQQEQLAAEATIKTLAQQQAAIDYAEAIHQALLEVENGLSADHHLLQRQHALATAANEAEQAATLSLERYQQGLTDILTLLNAQQRTFDSQQAQLQASLAYLNNRVTLLLALGGPYE